MKKFFAVLLTVLMVFAMGTAAFAADITISGGADGSQYAAFKLLNAEELANGNYSYTLNEKYAAALKTATGKDAEGDIVDYLAELDADGIKAFAADVYALIKNMTPDYTTANDEFKDVAQGYYLIAETKTGNAQDTFSLVMLDTAGNDSIDVETKEDTPTLEKKVQETNDSTGEVSDWQDGADYDIGDNVPFKLTGTVSAKYADYETYYYAFHDNMSDGLTFLPDSVVVMVDGAVVPATEYTVEFPAEDKHTFDVVFMDLKKLSVTVNANSKITVEYEATLNDDAVIGSTGNPNEAYLEYTNNPYYEGDGENKPGPEDTGHTPEDKVVVFTYKIVADKVDGKGAALEGAGFTLYKFDKEANDYVAVGDEITGVTEFTFKGVDAGEYKLVETTVPTGYNKADDVYFSVEATYDIEDDDPQLKTLVVKNADGDVISEGEEAVFTTSVNEGSVETKVVNLSGATLPTTGGVGTTIFYVIGAILMLGAAVLLITKKKMSANA